MYKIHLAYDNSLFGTSTSACERFKRRHSSSPINLKPKDFKETPEEDLCKRCCDIFLKRRNSQRASKGLPPVEKWNENFNGK